MLKTNIASNHGIIDYLGERVTLSQNGIEVPIELDFYWETTKENRVTQSLLDEWEYMFQIACHSIPNMTDNHLSIGGGGDSRIGSVLPKSVKNWVIVNPNILELKQVYNPHKINTILLRAIGEDIPIISNTFNSIDLLGTIDHLVDPSQALKELHRVSKKGAQLIISVTNCDSWYKKIFRVLKISIHEDHTHSHQFTPHQLKTLLVKSGYRIVKIQTTYFLRLPLIIEKKLTNKIWRKARQNISNHLLPKILGKEQGGIIICTAEALK